jgi:uroporphyrinogen decarboxylase
MTPYERIVSAVRHERQDRLPIDYTATPEAHARLKAHLSIEDDEALRRRLGCDIRMVAARYVGPADRSAAPGGGGAGKDFLGVVWKPAKNEFATYNEIAFSPLHGVTTVKQIDDYAWPSVDWFDYSHLADEIDRINRDERYCINLFVGGSFETPWYMRGLSRYLMDLVECPDIAEAISRHATEFYKQRALRAVEESKGKIDMAYSGGDIGTQRGMMLAPELWRRHIKPYSTQLIRTFKDMGLITMYHSCGGLVPVIEDLIEMGLDILDPIQPLAEGMEPAALKERFGDRLAFHGGIDEQRLLPYGTPDDVRRQVMHVMETLGNDGGYIVCPAHAIQPDTPPQNIMALYDTVLSAE